MFFVVCRSPEIRSEFAAMNVYTYVYAYASKCISRAASAVGEVYSMLALISRLLC